MESILVILYLIVFVIFILSLWKIFEKAGEKGWYALIPVLNGIILLRIVEKPWWWLFLLALPYVNIIYSIWVLNLLRIKFDKKGGFLVGLIFLSFIFFPILGFDDSSYLGKTHAKDESFIPILNGLYLGIVLILISVVYYVTGNTFAKSSQWVSYAVMIIGIIWAQINYKKTIGGTMNYGEALGVGILTMIIASTISSIYSFLLYSVIDPSLLEQLRLFTEEQIIKQGKVPEEQIDMAVEWATKFQKPVFMFIGGAIGGTFVGLIISLITSIFTQKKPTEDFAE